MLCHFLKTMPWRTRIPLCASSRCCSQCIRLRCISCILCANRCSSYRCLTKGSSLLHRLCIRPSCPGLCRQCSQGMILHKFNIYRSQKCLLYISSTSRCWSCLFWLNSYCLDLKSLFCRNRNLEGVLSRFGICCDRSCSESSRLDCRCTVAERRLASSHDPLGTAACRYCHSKLKLRGSRHRTCSGCCTYHKISKCQCISCTCQRCNPGTYFRQSHIDCICTDLHTPHSCWVCRCTSCTLHCSDSSHSCTVCTSWCCILYSDLPSTVDTHHPRACNHLHILSIADFHFHLVYNWDNLFCLESCNIGIFHPLLGRSRGHIISIY